MVCLVVCMVLSSSVRHFGSRRLIVESSRLFVVVVVVELLVGFVVRRGNASGRAILARFPFYLPIKFGKFLPIRTPCGTMDAHMMLSLIHI